MPWPQQSNWCIKWQTAQSNWGICGHDGTFLALLLHLFGWLFLTRQRKWHHLRNLRRTRPLHLVPVNSLSLHTQHAITDKPIFKTKAKYKMTCNPSDFLKVCSKCIMSPGWKSFPDSLVIFTELPCHDDLLWPKKTNWWVNWYSERSNSRICRGLRFEVHPLPVVLKSLREQMLDPASTVSNTHLVDKDGRLTRGTLTWQPAPAVVTCKPKGNSRRGTFVF